MPGTRKSWNSSQLKQQSRLQNLHTRLGNVREIKEGMGLHSPRIEELATRKMRADNPDLALDWDSIKQSERRHQTLMKKKDKKKQPRKN